jgi:DNA mismatch repair protein MutS
MAGMPPALIDRANEVLAQLEEKHDMGQPGSSSGHTPIRNKVKELNLPKMQLSIFDAHSVTFEEIRNLLDATDINRLTPVEALLRLQEIKNKIQ